MNPTELQKEFFGKYEFGRADMILTLKRETGKGSVSCNLRGPFRFPQPYTFGLETEMVFEPEWATAANGEQESNAHLHVSWEVKRAKLEVTNSAVRRNIRCNFQLDFLDEIGNRLFWFCIADDTHPAVRNHVDVSF